MLPIKAMIFLLCLYHLYGKLVNESHKKGEQLTALLKVWLCLTINVLGRDQVTG